MTMNSFAPRTVRRLIAASAVALLLVGCTADRQDSAVEDLGEPVASTALVGASAAAPTSGEYIADSGFRPTVDGFSFENYGNDGDVVNMRAQDIHALFGDDVCASGTGPECRLSSPAVTWMDQVNAAMDGGHCEGMAVMSQILHTGAKRPTDFGAEQTFQIDPSVDLEVYPAIARWFAMQATEPTMGANLEGLTPAEVVEQLERTLPGPRTPENTYTIAIFQADRSGGHAVTPYAIEDRGEGVKWILIYDNNHPGIPRAIEVDTDADTWSYEAATNPTDDSSLYEGDATTLTLELAPLAARLEPQTCPFCAGELDDDVAELNQLTLTGPGARLGSTDFYVTDPSGRAFGRRGGVSLSEIDGGTVTPFLTGLEDDPAPFLGVPAGFSSTVTIAAGDADADDMVFALVGAGYDAVVRGIDIAAGHEDRIELSQDGTRLTYVSHAARVPWIEVATELVVDDGQVHHYELRVRATKMAAPGRFGLVSPDGETDVYVVVSEDTTVDVEVVRYAPDGTETSVAARKVAVPEGAVLDVELSDWTGDATLTSHLLGADGSPTDAVIFR
ncbi:MAG: hypothetical protein M3Y51_02165 [Actinomycetota bacterium]|nr:hypothetical protein [Actinomycetota bacterium]